LLVQILKCIGAELYISLWPEEVCPLAVDGHVRAEPCLS